jgi:hypothetical protein
MTETIFDKTTGIYADMEYRRCSFAHCASNMMREYTGLMINSAVMASIIGNKMDEEVEEYLYDPNDWMMDTNIREEVMNMVSQHYLGHPWPTYGDNADMSLFETNLEEAVNYENNR